LINRYLKLILHTGDSAGQGTFGGFIEGNRITGFRKP
jgi:hypothetical protein